MNARKINQVQLLENDDDASNYEASDDDYEEITYPKRSTYPSQKFRRMNEIRRISRIHQELNDSGARAGPNVH